MEILTFDGQGRAKAQLLSVFCMTLSGCRPEDVVVSIIENQVSLSLELIHELNDSAIAEDQQVGPIVYTVFLDSSVSNTDSPVEPYLCCGLEME